MAYMVQDYFGLNYKIHIKVESISSDNYSIDLFYKNFNSISIQKITLYKYLEKINIDFFGF